MRIIEYLATCATASVFASLLMQQLDSAMQPVLLLLNGMMI